jgi:hypothetical protein
MIVKLLALIMAFRRMLRSVSSSRLISVDGFGGTGQRYPHTQT